MLLCYYEFHDMQRGPFRFQDHIIPVFVVAVILSLLFIRNNTFLFSSQIIYPYSSFSLFIFFMHVVCTADIMHALGLMPSASYFIYLVTSQENSTLAVSLSTNALKLYSPATGQFLGECTGHSGSIHEISFSAPSSPQVICSCSSDGTIRAWDTRSFKQVCFPNLVIKCIIKGISILYSCQLMYLINFQLLTME